MARRKHEQHHDLRALIAADLRRRAKVFPKWGPFLEQAESVERGAAYYATRGVLARISGGRFSGDPSEWLMVDADGNVNPAPLGHLTPEQRRTNSYVAPQNEEALPA